jgi:hypothetical protein
MARPKRQHVSVEEAAQRALAEAERVESDKAYTRMSATDKALVVQLAATGDKSQAQIATFMGCAPSTVSRILAECKDMAPAAKAFIQGQAMAMAENVVKNGSPDLHAKVLERFGAIPPEEKSGEGPFVIVLGSTDKPIVPPLMPVIEAQIVAAALAPGDEDPQNAA